MKILHINSDYLHGKFYKNLYDNQIKNELKINVFVPVSNELNIDKFDYGNYTLIKKSYNNYDRLIFHYKSSKIYKTIVKLYDIKSYTIIHAHFLFSNGFIALKLKKKFGIPYIVAVRNTDLNIFFKKMIHLRKLGIEILKEANHIIFLSESYKDSTINEYIPTKLKQIIYSKSTVLPNGIDLFWLTNKAKPKVLKDRLHIEILHVGDINKNKNVLSTAMAIKELNKVGVNAKLNIVGNIKNKNIFKKISRLNFVNYLGFKTKEELMGIYRNNDIFILPSINETFGLVYAEAMSQGLPIIYSKNQGFDKQFTDGVVGYSVNPIDSIEIFKSILKIIEYYTKLSKNGIDLCEKFNWENITKEYIYLYKKINNFK